MPSQKSIDYKETAVHYYLVEYKYVEKKNTKSQEELLI
jgi:hypothetical protein